MGGGNVKRNALSCFGLQLAYIAAGRKGCTRELVEEKPHVPAARGEEYGPEKI